MTDHDRCFCCFISSDFSVEELTQQLQDLRQYEYDTQDLRELKFDSFRKYISIIPQNGILFNDTILFNLQYGNPDASMEEIIEIAKKCEIHDKVMDMPDGYDTQVGDLGGKLSGGERQRVLIARGLLKNDAKIFPKSN